MVQITTLPDDALLQTYARRPECYTDCFSIKVPNEVSLPDLIMAFYSTRLFGLERLILKWAVHRPSTAADIKALAQDKTRTFAAWSVEARDIDQLLMCDMQNRTRSWLMVRPRNNGTELLFGSAVTPPLGGQSLGPVFTALLGFHKLYSRALLRSAARAI